jgi:hypothetical protein
MKQTMSAMAKMARPSLLISVLDRRVIGSGDPMMMFP